MGLRKRGGISTTYSGGVRPGIYLTTSASLTMTAAASGEFRLDMMIDWVNQGALDLFFCDEILIDLKDNNSTGVQFRWDGTNGFNDALSWVAPTTGVTRLQFKFIVDNGGTGGVGRVRMWTRDMAVYDYDVQDDDEGWVLEDTVEKAGAFSSASGATVAYAPGYALNSKMTSCRLYEMYVDTDVNTTPLHFDGDLDFDYENLRNDGVFATRQWNIPNPIADEEDYGPCMDPDGMILCVDAWASTTAGDLTLTAASESFGIRRVHDATIYSNDYLTGVLVAGSPGAEGVPVLSGAGAGEWTFYKSWVTSTGGGDDDERVSLWFGRVPAGGFSTVVIENPGIDHIEYVIGIFANLDADNAFQSDDFIQSTGTAMTAPSVDVGAGAAMFNIFASGVQTDLTAPANSNTDDLPLQLGRVVDYSGADTLIKNSWGHDGTIGMYYGTLSFGGASGVSSVTGSSASKWIGISLGGIANGASPPPLPTNRLAIIPPVPLFRARDEHYTPERYQADELEALKVQLNRNTDQLKYFIRRPLGANFGVAVRLASDQTITNGVWVPIRWDAEQFDTPDRDMWSNADRDQILIKHSGWYMISLGVKFEAGISDLIACKVKRNNLDLAHDGHEYTPSHAWDMSLRVATCWRFEYGDVVSAEVYQASTAAKDILAESAGTYLRVAAMF